MTSIGQGNNFYEEAWVQQAMAQSMQHNSGQVGPISPIPAISTDSTPLVGPSAGQEGEEDADLQRALRESAAESSGHADNDLSDDAALQRALRESAAAANGSFGVRRLMSHEGPFYPAGLANSGNSCFWNALLQVLFAATPVFRGALFQLDFAQTRGPEKRSSSLMPDPVEVLGLLRDLFAEMDMGLVSAIDAGDLYRKIFQKAEEADVSEQMHKLFELITVGSGPLEAVCRELFSGDLYEHVRKAPVRRIPLDLCQLDLCVIDPAPLERLLEEHTLDVKGSIERRSYRLPPVLWLNLDRFAYDQEAQSGRKRQVRLTFPEVLNAWMLVPPEDEWAVRLRELAQRRHSLSDALQANRAEVSLCAREGATGSEDIEVALTRLVEEQESLTDKLQSVEEAMNLEGAQQELLYDLQAVIVHRGRVDSGHYFAYARSPVPGSSDWCCLNDAQVAVCSAGEMRRVCEGGLDEAECSIPLQEAAKEPAASSNSTGSAVNNAALNGQQLDESAAPPAAEQSRAVQDSGMPSSPPMLSLPAGPAETNSTAVSATASSPSSAAEAGKRSPKSSQGTTGPAVVSSPRPPTSSVNKRHALWSSMSSMFGCLPRSGSVISTSEDSEHLQASPTKYPNATAQSSKASPGDSSAKNAQGVVDTLPDTMNTTLSGGPQSNDHVSASQNPFDTAAGAPCLPQQESEEPAAEVASSSPLSEESTAARCLVYVRSGAGGDNLLSEVKRRVPHALQEKIDIQNTELLCKSIEQVVDDFVECVRRITARTPGEKRARHDLANDDVNNGIDNTDNDYSNPPNVSLDDTLRAAEHVRAEGGMARTRMFLLRSCWRLRIPWLPEELYPAAMPPDFRMHYGTIVKRMLLDFLIKRGQHDMANLIVAGTPATDAFIPRETEEWLASRDL